MLSICNLTKSYKVGKRRHYVFRDATVSFPDDANIGIIGPNGAGKTTLLRILGGIDYPDSGQILTDQSFSWPLGLRGGFVPHLTGRENCRMVCQIYGIDRQNMAEKLANIKELTGIEDYFEQPVKYYSSGMNSRLGFALSMAFDFDYFLIDEITAVGDAKFRDLAKKTLLEKARTSRVVMVSHNMADIRSFCDIAVLVRNGGIETFNSINDAIDAYMPKQSYDPEDKIFVEQKVSLKDIGLDIGSASGDEADAPKQRMLDYIATYLEQIVTKMADPELRIAGKPEDVYHSLGLTYASLGLLAEAEDQFRRALDVSPARIDSLVHLAQLYEKRLRLEDAIELYQKALQVDPKYRNANFNLARLYFRMHQFTEALERLDVAIDVSPRDGQLWKWKADTLKALGRPDDASDAAIKAVQLTPNNPALQLQLSEHLMEMGAYRPAIELRKKSLARRHDEQYAEKSMERLLEELEKLDSKLETDAV